MSSCCFPDRNPGVVMRYCYFPADLCQLEGINQSSSRCLGEIKVAYND